MFFVFTVKKIIINFKNIFVNSKIPNSLLSYFHLNLLIIFLMNLNKFVKF
jgi:hypothetical protein